MATADSGVQTAQEARSAPEPYPGQGESAAVCLRSPRGGMLRVVSTRSRAYFELTQAGWAVAEDVRLGGSCPCGCGLPIPFIWERDKPSPQMRILQKYADPENCRKALYALQHPTLDLSGLPPVKAKHAARMAEEAVKAAKLGQGRATVDASRSVEHQNAVRRDSRPSNRLRLSERHWQMLGEIKALGFHQARSYSAIAEELIEQELELCRARAREAEEHNV